MEPPASKESSNPRAERYFSFRPARKGGVPPVEARPDTAPLEQMQRRFRFQRVLDLRECIAPLGGSRHASTVIVRAAFGGLTICRQEHHYGYPQIIRKQTRSCGRCHR
jgi:hypothetical protein